MPTDGQTADERRHWRVPSEGKGRACRLWIRTPKNAPDLPLDKPYDLPHPASIVEPRDVHSAGDGHILW